MERKFYPESFEKFLKGHADQFKMTPSKKAWHGIYNDLHPGRRWPSVTMSFVFIFALVIIGHLNTSNPHNNSFNLKVLSASSPKSTTATQLKTKSNISKTTSRENHVSTPAPENTVIPNTNSLATSAINNNTQSVINNSIDNKVNSNNIISDNNENSSSKNQEVLSGKTLIAEKESGNISTKGIIPIDVEPNANNILQDATKSDLQIPASINQLNDNISTITNRKIRKNPAIFTYYISPSLSYRKFSDLKINNTVNHKTMLGYEGGIAISSKIKDKLHFTTGFQVNYSGYKIKASSTHPILAALILTSDLPGQVDIYSTMSYYSNGNANSNEILKNYTLQVSVPIGFHYSFGGNDDIKFNAEATLQPGAIIKSKAYMLSSDGKNYMTAPDVYRKWNMSTNLGTYVSIKSSSYNWQIGPQVRYQLLSTYSKNYPVKEHLINYGIRIGISKIPD